jgi:hypothetical protein
MRSRLRKSARQFNLAGMFFVALVFLRKEPLQPMCLFIGKPLIDERRMLANRGGSAAHRLGGAGSYAWESLRLLLSVSPGLSWAVQADGGLIIGSVIDSKSSVRWSSKGNDMDEALKAKLDEARNRMNSQQAGINANRKHDDQVVREWARGKQRPANAERARFKKSLTNEERNQIEQRIQQILDDNPALSSANLRTEPSVSVDVLDEYYFLRDMVA